MQLKRINQTFANERDYKLLNMCPELCVWAAFDGGLFGLNGIIKLGLIFHMRPTAHEQWKQYLHHI